MPWETVIFYFWAQVFLLSLCSILLLSDTKILQRFLFVLVLLLSYPNLIALHTGNFEGFIGILLLLSAFAYKSNRNNLFLALIVVAGSIKIYPFIFLIILFHRYSWRQSIFRLCFSLFISFVIQILALTLLPNGLLDRGFGVIGSIVNE